MAGIKTLNLLGEIAAEQWGLITRRQALNGGLPRTTFDRLAAEGSILERVAQGVYRLTLAPIPDHLALRAAWLQLVPDVPAWQRNSIDGVVSHRSAADLYRIGHLPADRHEFTVTKRKQSRRSDVHIYVKELKNNEWIELNGLPVTIPSRTALDLLRSNEDPTAVAQVIADAIRNTYDYPAAIAKALRPLAFRFGFRREDGIGLLSWLLDLVGDPNAPIWLKEARENNRRQRNGTNHPSGTGPYPA